MIKHTHTLGGFFCCSLVHSTADLSYREAEVRHSSVDSIEQGEVRVQPTVHKRVRSGAWNCVPIINWMMEIF